MATSAFFYNNWKKAIGGAVDLTGGSYKMTLHSSSYVPSVSSHAVYADLSNELVTANGYTNGGLLLTGVTWSLSSGTATYPASPIIWNATGGNIVCRYAVLRAVGTFNGQVDPLVLYYLLDNTPADVTATTGNNLTITPAGSGIFTLT